MNQSDKRNVGLPILMAVIGLVVGFAITITAAMAYYKPKVDSATMNSAMATTDTKAADFRADMITLGLKHMTLTNQAVDAALDGSPDADATGAALYANGNTIGAALGTIYGKDAETTFDSVWKLHLDEFVKYAVAGKGGDTAGQQAALDSIKMNYTMPLAQYLAKANPNLPEADLEASLNEHVAMTANMIDEHIKGDYTAEAMELDMANTHMKELFSTLAGAIVKQYPDKF